MSLFSSFLKSEPRYAKLPNDILLVLRANGKNISIETSKLGTAKHFEKLNVETVQRNQEQAFSYTSILVGSLSCIIALVSTYTYLGPSLQRASNQWQYILYPLSAISLNGALNTRGLINSTYDILHKLGDNVLNYSGYKHNDDMNALKSDEHKHYATRVGYLLWSVLCIGLTIPAVAPFYGITAQEGEHLPEVVPYPIRKGLEGIKHKPVYVGIAYAGLFYLPVQQMAEKALSFLSARLSPAYQWVFAEKIKVPGSDLILDKSNPNYEKLN